MKEAKKHPSDHECDYLVVGAGTAGMSFIDTLLTESISAKVILVDRNDKPGGHWTTAYPFVRLHQPSGNYGVNSEPLGKSLNKKGYEKLDPNDRATGKDVVKYYVKVLDKFKTSYRFKSFFRTKYERQVADNMDSSVRSIRKSDGEVILIRCKKLVMIHTKVVVPSMRKGPPFPVHEEVNFVPINDLQSVKASGQYTNYVILGAGKTGTDAVVELLKSGVDQSCIKWIISRDMWFLLRDNLYTKNYYRSIGKLIQPITTAATMKDTFLEWEKEGIVGRLDPKGQFPKLFKSAAIDTNELLLIRTIKDTVRLGRVTAIRSGGMMVFGGDQDDNTKGSTVEVLNLSSSNHSTVFIDCMANDFYGYFSFPKDFKIFERNQINLGPIVTLSNPSFSSALIAFMETWVGDNDMKNNCFFYFSCEIPPHQVDYARTFLGQIYNQMKTLEFLVGTYPPVQDFILNSRTNIDAPLHHGGMFNFLWAMLGPLQLIRKGVKIERRIKQENFTDFKCEAEILVRQMPKISRRQKRILTKQHKKLKEKARYKNDYINHIH